MRSLLLAAHHYLVLVIKIIIFLLFSVMIVTGFGQVVLRYFFGLAYAWASEVAQFAMVWMCFLGAAVLALEEGHTNVDYFLNLLPSWLRLPISIISNLILVLFIGSLIYYFIPTWEVHLRTSTPGLEISMGWVTFSAILGLGLTAVYTVIRALRSAPPRE